jgi:hypothetical protein
MDPSNENLKKILEQAHLETSFSPVGKTRALRALETAIVSIKKEVESSKVIKS